MLAVSETPEIASDLQYFSVKASCTGPSAERNAARAIGFGAAVEGLHAAPSRSAEPREKEEMPLAVEALLQTAADIYNGPFSPELASKSGQYQGPSKAGGRGRGCAISGQLDETDLSETAAKEQPMTQKARKTTKGCLTKQTLLPSKQPTSHCTSARLNCFHMAKAASLGILDLPKWPPLEGLPSGNGYAPILSLACLHSHKAQEVSDLFKNLAN